MTIVVHTEKTILKKRVDDIVFYPLDGKIVARTIGYISKEKFAKSPRYKSLRQIRVNLA